MGWDGAMNSLIGTTFEYLPAPTRVHCVRAVPVSMRPGLGRLCALTPELFVCVSTGSGP